MVFGLASLLGRILFVLLRPLFRRLTKEQDDRELATIVAPLRLQLLGLLFYAGSFFAVTLFGRHFLDRVALTLTVIAACWLLLRLMDVVAHLTLKHLQRLNRSGDTALVRLLSRLSKAAAVIIAGLFLLHLSGVHLTAVFAGLGVGALAIGFGAQKTIENLFGGVMVISDKPVSVGDVCRAGEFFGTVEDIGLRSTRIRTMNRTVVAIPNGQLAAMSLENFSMRDRVWLHHTVGLRYETTADQLRYVLAEIRRLLYAHPKVESESARTRFVRFGGSSLDLEIFAYVLATDYAVFLAIQEDLLLRIMDIIDASGTSIAFPSQTTYFARDQRLDASKTEKALATVQAWREGNELPFPDFSTERISELSGKIEYPCPESVLRTERGVEALT
jgi:MscS family membrane protein